MQATLEFSPRIFGSHVNIRVNLKGINNKQLHKKARAYIGYFANNNPQFKLELDCGYTLYFNAAIDKDAPHVSVNCNSRNILNIKYKLITFPYSKL